MRRFISHFLEGKKMALKLTTLNTKVMVKTLEIEVEKARSLYKTASPDFKILLEENFSKEELAGKLIDRINSYEDACNELGEKPIDIEALQIFFRNQLIEQGFPYDRIDTEIHAKVCLIKIETITRAMNRGKVADWTNPHQRKYIPWFKFSPSGFAFDYSYYGYTDAGAGGGSRLCLIGEDNEETQQCIATIATRFSELYKGIIL